MWENDSDITGELKFNQNIIVIEIKHIYSGRKTQEKGVVAERINFTLIPIETDFNGAELQIRSRTPRDQSATYRVLLY